MTGLLTAAFAWQSRAVVERHLRVHLRNWHTAFLPPALEPVTNLLAFGLGLGGYVGVLAWRGRELPYLSYIAPGMLAYTTFMTAMFQSLYAAFIRMHFQKTWEGQLTTQVELRHVVWGEVLWAALMTTMYATVVAVVLTAFRLARAAGALTVLDPAPALPLPDELCRLTNAIKPNRSEAEALLTSMYQADPTPVGTTGLETFEAINTLLRAPTPPPSNGAQYPNGNTGNALRQAAGLIKNGVGTRTIYVNVTGAFDTHSNQLAGNTNDYRPLGQALAAFATDLGGLLDDVVLLVTTEFGRTARVNGAAGTDHGTGYAMMVLGGRVRGGRVLGRWPGLSSSQLYQNRDLAATTDFRDVFQEVARAQFGISASLFPGYTPGPGVGVV